MITSQSSFDRTLYSNEKMQFYPTDPGEVKKIRGLFDFTQAEEICLVEPCYGDGKALRTFKGNAPNIKTFGVELNKLLYDGVEDIDYKVNGDFLKAKITGKSFSLCFCNPPYGQDLEGGRIEDEFLKTITKYMITGGHLVWVVPSTLFETNKRHLMLLSNRYKILDVFKFAEPEFSKFKQVVLICEKRNFNTKDANQEERVAEMFLNVSEMQEVPEEYDQIVVLPSYEEKVKVFAPYDFDYDGVIESIDVTGLFTRLELDSVVEPFGFNHRRPPVYPNGSQIFTMASVGRIEISETDGFLSRGMLKEDTSQEERDGKLVEKKFHRAGISILEPTGIKRLK